MKSPLDQLEERFKSIFEGNSIFNGQPVSIVNLFQFLDDYLKHLIEEKEEIPTKFGIYLNQADTTNFDEQPALKDAIAQGMVELASHYGYSFPKTPGIKLITKNSLLPGQFEIKPIRLRKQMDQTSSIQVMRKIPVESEIESNPQASLLFGDDTLYYISGPVTNLGRKSNNHIVFEDLRVSRNHAQIRQVYDGYIIFDTGSSGGTFVNGKRVTQCNLKTGDVISLAGVKLIFSEEIEDAAEPKREITSKLNSPKKEE